MKKLYTSERWNDDPKAKVIGKKRELTEEEKMNLKELKKYSENLFKKAKRSNGAT